jgi:hypothetical protein
MWGYYFGVWDGDLTDFPHLGVWGIFVEFGVLWGCFGCAKRAAAWWGLTPRLRLDECFGLKSTVEI